MLAGEIMSYRIEISGLIHCGDPRGHATLDKIKQFLDNFTETTVNPTFYRDEIIFNAKTKRSNFKSICMW